LVIFWSFWKVGGRLAHFGKFARLGQKSVKISKK